MAQKAQDARASAPRLVTALDRTWSAIRGRHPDVPEVVIALGSGTGGRAAACEFGHFAADRWERGDGRAAGAVRRRRGPVPRRPPGARHAAARGGPRHGQRARGSGHQPSGPLAQRPVPRPGRRDRHRRGQGALARLERHDRAGRHRRAVPGRAPPPGRRDHRIPARRAARHGAAAAGPTTTTAWPPAASAGGGSASPRPCSRPGRSRAACAAATSRPPSPATDQRRAGQSARTVGPARHTPVVTQGGYP